MILQSGNQTQILRRKGVRYSRANLNVDFVSFTVFACSLFQHWLQLALAIVLFHLFQLSDVVSIKVKTNVIMADI